MNILCTYIGIQQSLKTTLYTIKNNLKAKESATREQELWEN